MKLLNGATVGVVAVCAVSASGWSYSINPVYFARGSATLSEDSKVDLDVGWARYLRMEPGWKSLTVECHADEEGSPSEMLELSERRAEEVARELARLGFDRGAIHRKGYGDERQTLGEPGEKAAQWNRRCELAVER